MKGETIVLVPHSKRESSRSVQIASQTRVDPLNSITTRARQVTRAKKALAATVCALAKL